MRALHASLARLVGTWTLVATSNPTVPLRSELFVDYSQVEFTTTQNIGVARLQKTCYGRVIGTGARSNVVWLKLLDYRVDTGILPPIQIPAPPQTLYRMRIHHVREDDVSASFTVKAAEHSYTFCKTLVRSRDPPLLKLVFTQLVFEGILHLKDII